MKGLALVDKGLEEVAIDEIFEKIKSKGKFDNSVVSFSISKEEELCKLAYTCQSVRRILLVLKEVKVSKDLEENISILKKEVNKLDLKSFSSNKINVECERVGEHDFNSVDYSRELSKILYDKKLEVTREGYDTVFYVYINGTKGFLCVDYSGRDLSKRNYRIFTKATTLKGTLAYALVRFSNYKPGEIILDPSCESGVVPIEASMSALNKPINFYHKEFAFQKLNEKFRKVFETEDKKIKTKIKGIHAFDKQLSNVHSAKKNAKIAGVEKNITFSKLDIEWLDTKFEKESVDKIIVRLPSESKNISEKLIQKIYDEFFYQSEFILKKQGLVVVCSLKDKQVIESANKKGFKVSDKKTIFSGQQEFCVNIFKKA